VFKVYVGGTRVAFSVGAGGPGKRDRVPSKDLLITGGHVVTMDPNLGDLPGADVLIRDGAIAAIGSALAELAPGALAIDGPPGDARADRHPPARLAGRDSERTSSAPARSCTSPGPGPGGRIGSDAQARRMLLRSRRGGPEFERFRVGSTSP
jgi:hypothetical protein